MEKLRQLGEQARSLQFYRIKSVADAVYKEEEAEYAWDDAIHIGWFDDGFGLALEVKESTWTDIDGNQHRYTISQRRGQSMH